MPYLIDSDWSIDYLLDEAEAVRLLNRLAPERLSMSIITYMEIYEGLIRAPSIDEAEAKLLEFAEVVPIIPLSTAIARRCALLRQTLRRLGRRVRPRSLDLLIAATALELDLVLVTRNVSDYSDIPGVSLYSP